MPNMSVLSAVASVGAEITNTRVEIPAVVTPIIELTRTKRRMVSLLFAEESDVTVGWAQASGYEYCDITGKRKGKSIDGSNSLILLPIIHSQFSIQIIAPD